MSEKAEAGTSVSGSQSSNRNVSVPIAAIGRKRTDGNKSIDRVVSVPIAEIGKKKPTGNDKTINRTIAVPIAPIGKSKKEPVATTSVPIAPIGKSKKEPVATTSGEARSCSVDVSVVRDGISSLNIGNRRNNRYTETPEEAYINELRVQAKLFQVDDGHAVAVADWSVVGRQLLSNYCIVSPLRFIGPTGNASTLLICTCGDSIGQSQRLLDIDSQQRVSSDFLQTERAQYCIHRRAINRLNLELTSDGDEDDEDESGLIEQLRNDPLLLWAVKDDASRTIGVIERSRKGALNCLVCKKAKCLHTNYFTREKETFGIELPAEEIDPNSAVKIISRTPIALDDDVLKRHRYPVERDLVPGINSAACLHGHAWSALDPIREGWKVSVDCTIFGDRGRPYTGGPVYYRRSSSNQCDCKCYPDGSEFGLLNINNKIFVEYRVLIQYVSSYRRSGLPLKSFYDSLAEYNRLDGNETISYDRLYLSWSAFSSLIRLDENDFCCTECGKYPATVVLDGTALSCRKDLVPSSELDLGDCPILFGIDHRNRVFIRQKQTRDLLMLFATGQIRGNKKAMNRSDVVTLLEKLLNERSVDDPLYLLVLELSADNTCQSPAPYKALLKELAKNTPIAGVFQIGDDRGIRQVVEEIISGTIDIGSSVDSTKMDLLRLKVPAIVECLNPIRKATGHLPINVRNVLSAMLGVMFGGFEACDERSSSSYSSVEATDHSLAHFPCWPVVRGYGKYDDRSRSARDEADSCTKFRHGHKVLGPGIVTYLCPHGICYGFAVMKSYESPRMPFDIFFTRYTPKNVVYDNACKLHLYCLKREPLHFQNCRFFVDRFHWFNHSACSIGYDIKRYKTDENLLNLNSEASEQLNSRLFKLRTSLSYMKYEKFMDSLKLFLALHNRNMCNKV